MTDPLGDNTFGKPSVEPVHDSLDEKARRLEQIHQQLVSSMTDLEIDVPCSLSDHEMVSAEYVLRMIEKVRREPGQPNSASANLETPLNFQAETVGERDNHQFKNEHEAQSPPKVKEQHAEPSAASNLPSIDESLEWLHSDQPIADALPAPRKIGRFQIERLLGRGGAGLVFLAHDPRLLRPVALKIPRLDALVSGQLSDRFLREAKAAALLSHPHIVTVYDAGFVGPAVYVASQFVPGPNLAEWLLEHPDELSPVEAAKIVAALASAVQHAHSRGVIHRDLKPSNIQVDHSNPLSNSLADQVRITDFGLARIESNSEASLQATASGAVIGTPAYMSPEQARGETTTCGAAVDIYSLGAILYELLTGKPPHLKSSVPATLRAVELDEPVAPSRIKRTIPPDLEAVCLKCLEKRPERRYASAYALESDLQRFVHGEPVSARRIGSLQKLARWCQRRPALAAVSGLAAFLFLIGFALVAWQWRRAERHLKLAVSATELADAESIRARESARYARQALDDMTSQVATEWLLGQPQLSAEQKNFLRSAIVHYRRFASESADDESGEAQVASAAFQLGTLLRRLGETEEALAAYGHARDVWQILAETNPGQLSYRYDLARANYALQIILRAGGRLDEAESAGQIAMHLLQQLLIEDPDDDAYRNELAKVITNQGNLFRVTNRLEEAAAAHSASIELLQQLIADHPDNAEYRQTYSMALNNLGIVRFLQQQSDESSDLFEKSLVIKEQLVSDFPQQRKYAEDLALGLINHSSLMKQLGQLEPAEELTRRAIDHYDRLIGTYPSRPDYRELQASARLNLGTILLRLGREDEAESQFVSAIGNLKVLREQYPESWSSAHMLAAGLESLGDVERDRANLLSALDLYDEAIDGLEPFHLAQPQSMPITDRLLNLLIARATVRAWLGEHDDALADWDRAIELGAPAARAGWRLARATTLIRAGRYSEAVAEANELTPGSEDLAVLFNGACVYALASGIELLDIAEREYFCERAFELLRKCISRGFRDEKKLRTDPDFLPLRQHLEFEALFDLLKSGIPPGGR
jgi:serine/threonine protein kinase